MKSGNPELTVIKHVPATYRAYYRQFIGLCAADDHQDIRRRRDGLTDEPDFNFAALTGPSGQSGSVRWVTNAMLLKTPNSQGNGARLVELAKEQVEQTHAQGVDISLLGIGTLWSSPESVEETLRAIGTDGLYFTIDHHLREEYGNRDVIRPWNVRAYTLTPNLQRLRSLSIKWDF